MKKILKYVFFDRICKHYVPVREPRRRVYRRVVEAEYETVCAPDGRRCTKTRPEYREEQTIRVSFPTDMMILLYFILYFNFMKFKSTLT